LRPSILVAALITVKLHAVVDSGLEVVLKVTYLPAKNKRTTVGCFYTTNFIEGAHALRSRARSFALKKGANSLTVPVDEVLPGVCDLEPYMSFEVTDAMNGVKAIGGSSGINLQKAGSKNRPLEVVECRARRGGSKPDMYCASQWTWLPTFEARAAEAKRFQIPISTKGGEIALEFRLRGAHGEQTNPSLQTGPAASGRPAELQR
jgi:hypothetical protein